MESRDIDTDIFCTNVIDRGTFYMSKYTRAICDIAPVMPGHSLIIPLRHVMDITELTEEESQDLLRTVKKIKPAIIKLYGDESKSYDLTAQMGEYSGMSIKHLHFHLIPRKKTDPYQHGNSVFNAIERMKKIPDEEYGRYVSALRKELKWGK